MISELCCRITRYEVINVTVITEKWLSKAVNRMTDNVMVYKTLQRKLMVEQQQPYKKSGAIQNKRVYVTLRKKIYIWVLKVHSAIQINKLVDFM